MIHERQHEIRVTAYAGEDNSIAEDVRITIPTPPTPTHSPPQFNSTSWPNQVTIFCVVGSTSENQCGGGAAIDLKQYFSDPDSSFNQLSIDFLDDQTDPTDDSHPYFITIDSEGFARYDPAISQSNEDITTWTIDNVRFIVRDASDESALSRDVTFFVQAIEFGVERDNPTSTVTATSTANFSGTRFTVRELARSAAF